MRHGNPMLGKVIATILVVIGAGAAIGMTLQSSGQPAGEASEPAPKAQEASKPIPVALTPARQMTFETRIEVAGSVHADHYALVSARMPGPLDAIFVDEGDAVEAGKTRLFQTDSLKLTKALASAQQGYTVAQCSVAEKEASLERSLADEGQAKADLARFRELVQHHAVARQQFEQQESRYKQSAAMVKHARALIDLAKAQLEQARLAVTMTEKDLADSLVVAPITGRVAERMKEPGEMAGAGTPVLRIEDPSVLEVSVFLPEEFYARVEPGRTQMRVTASGSEVGVYPVSYKSPTVNPKLRTFQVKSLVHQPPQGVVPGCLAQVVILLESRTGLGVPVDAIQKRQDGLLVFVVHNQQAHAVPVKTGLEMDGWKEILAGELRPGMPVVTMGQHLVDEGRPVTVMKGAAR